jgi:hypothetical protein
VLAIGRGGSQRRERLLTTGECPTWREAHACASVRLARGDGENRRACGAADGAVAHVVFGGRRGDDEDPSAEEVFMNDLHVIDDAFRWRAVTAAGPAPSPRAGHCFVAVSDDEIACFGGRGARGEIFDDVHFLKCESSSSRSSSARRGRDQRTNDERDERDPLADMTCVWRRSEKASTPHASRPRAREGAAAAFTPPTASAKKGTLWVFGGCGGEDGETLFDDVWAFDVDSETWRAVGDDSVGDDSNVDAKSPTRPKPRFGHACAVVRVAALVDVKPMGASKTRDGAVVNGTSSSCIDAADDLVLVAHGGVDGDSRTLSDLWTFSFKRETWREVSGENLVGFVPKPRACFAAVLCGARVLFLGGIQDARAATPSNLGEASALALRGGGEGAVANANRADAPARDFGVASSVAEREKEKEKAVETVARDGVRGGDSGGDSPGDFDYAGAFRATTEAEDARTSEEALFLDAKKKKRGKRKSLRKREKKASASRRRARRSPRGLLSGPSARRPRLRLRPRLRRFSRDARRRRRRRRRRRFERR